MHVEQSPKCTTPQETKVDQSVEISRKSHDMNLEIPYDENLEINIYPSVAMTGLAALETCLPQPTTADAHAVDSLLSLAANKLLFLKSDKVC